MELIKVIAFLLTVSGAYAACCKNGWVTYEESCYLFGKDAMTFVTAEQFCTQHGGHLVHVEDARENNFIRDQLRERGDINWWLGITDETIDGEWRWYDTDTVAEYTNFLAGDGGDHNKEDCAMYAFGTDFQWIDVVCTASERPVCKQA